VPITRRRTGMLAAAGIAASAIAFAPAALGQGSANTVELAGGETSLHLNDATAKVLTDNGVSVAPIGRASANGAIDFPITGGDIVPNTGAGDYEHRGSGLRFSAGGPGSFHPGRGGPVGHAEEDHLHLVQSGVLGRRQLQARRHGRLPGLRIGGCEAKIGAGMVRQKPEDFLACISGGPDDAHRRRGQIIRFHGMNMHSVQRGVNITLSLFSGVFRRSARSDVSSDVVNIPEGVALRFHAPASTPAISRMRPSISSRASGDRTMRRMVSSPANVPSTSGHSSKSIPAATVCAAPLRVRTTRR